MKVAGRRILQYPADILYHHATDFAGIAAEFTQVSDVTIDGDHIRIVVQMDLGIHSGTYHADFVFVEKEPPYRFRIRGIHKSRLGGMKLDFTGTITPVGAGSHEVSIEGDFTRSGMLRLGAKPVVKKGVEIGIKWMFDIVERRILADA